MHEITAEIQFKHPHVLPPMPLLLALALHIITRIKPLSRRREEKPAAVVKKVIGTRIGVNVMIILHNMRKMLSYKKKKSQREKCMYKVIRFKKEKN